jgi:hypothetical protein
MFYLDAHCHFYECFSLEIFLQDAFKNAANSTSSVSFTSFGIILTERNDCNFYERLFSDQSLSNDITVLGYKHDKNLVFDKSNSLSLIFYPGRQVSTNEKIEVLALFCRDPLPENMSLEDLTQHISKSGAIPVINWAPGKWTGKRGRVVQEFVTKNPEKITLGITSLLPEHLPYPSIVRKAFTTDIPLIAGSDPLPFSGQESLACSYGMLFPSLSDQPSDHEIKEAIMNKTGTITGQRSSIPGSFIRLFKNELARRNL